MQYHAPTTLNDALALMVPGTLTVIAGGTDLFPAAGRRITGPGLLDVSRIPDMRGLSSDGPGWRIGAATRWSDVVHADLPPAFDGLKAAAREVGSVQIQNSGTVAGNICNASPAADGVPPLLTLDANVELAGPRGQRQLPLAEFLVGVRQTRIAPDELVTAITGPHLPAHVQGAFGKLGSRRYLVISITMTAALIGLDGDGRIDFARVAVGACSPVAQRLTTLETALIGTRPGDIVIDLAHLAPLAPITDIRGSAGYRADAVSTQVRDTILRAARTDV